MIHSPRARVGCLLAISLSAFFIEGLEPLLALVLLQAGLWTLARLPMRDLARALSRLLPFSLSVLILFALFPPEGAGPATREWTVLGLRLGWHPDGLGHGARMILRVLAVVAASGWARRTGAPGDFVAGLRGWLLPEAVAGTIAATLSMLDSEPEQRGGGGGGGGRGRGDGGGRNARAMEAGQPTLRRILKGEVDFLPGLIDSSVARARGLASGMSSAELRDDVAVLSGVCLLMLGAKLAKILPGIPFAPGYKTALLLPLYFVAADRTRMRLGATVAGTTLGVISFLFGDGRYGVFEILKHLAPGLVVDAAAPAFGALRGRTVPFVVISAFAAAARLSSILAVVWLVDGNAALYAAAALQGSSQLAFGAASGVVAARLLRARGNSASSEEERNA
ncbi:MAG: hypothetical protein HYV14_06685 [Elusimicrobia bacterium]|nr:hypothetical protein [Elusimicrobiota bacterium]